MHVHMVARDFQLTPLLRDYLERRLRFAFSPMLTRVGRIAVRLRDLNGPRGGRDMACRVCVQLPGSPEVVVNEVQEDMYNAIDLAVKRAAYRVSRLLVRRRMGRRRVRVSARSRAPEQASP